MSLSNPITDKVISDNEVYTQECQKIYDNLHFAKVTEIKLWQDIMYRVDIFLSVLILAILGAYTIPALVIGRRNLTMDIFFACLLVIFASIIVTSAILCKISYKKKRREFYFIRTDEGEYKLKTENIKGKLYIKYIELINESKRLVFESNECKIYDMDKKEGLYRYIGFYQYLVEPTQVFPNAKWPSYSKSHIRYLYKKKRVNGNKTYYFFKSFGGVVGARYARCIKLKDGVVKCVTKQTTRGEYRYYQKGGDSLIYDNYKYTYDFVNDGSLKIYIPSYAVDFAKKNKFILPLQSENLVVEE